MTPDPSHAQCQAWWETETALGTLRWTWTPLGLARLCLPPPPELGGERACPEWGPRLERELQRFARGEASEFEGIPLDRSRLTDFQREVSRACVDIARGETLTYAELALRTGRSVRAARAVGVALSKNPYPLVVPCHRVLGAKRTLTGFTAPGGVETKRRLLLLEGVEV